MYVAQQKQLGRILFHPSPQEREQNGKKSKKHKGNLNEPTKLPKNRPRKLGTKREYNATASFILSLAKEQHTKKKMQIVKIIS